MRYFLIPNTESLDKIFLCAIIILIAQLIGNIIILNQLLEDLGKVVRSIFIEIETS